MLLITILIVVVVVVWIAVLHAVFTTLASHFEFKLLRRRDFIWDHAYHFNIHINEDDLAILNYIRDETPKSPLVMTLDVWLAEMSLPNTGIGRDFLRAEKNILTAVRSASV